MTFYDVQITVMLGFYCVCLDRLINVQICSGEARMEWKLKCGCASRTLGEFTSRTDSNRQWATWRHSRILKYEIPLSFPPWDVLWCVNTHIHKKAFIVSCTQINTIQCMSLYVTLHKYTHAFLHLRPSLPWLLLNTWILKRSCCISNEDFPNNQGVPRRK